MPKRIDLVVRARHEFPGLVAELSTTLLMVTSYTVDGQHAARFATQTVDDELAPGGQDNMIIAISEAIDALSPSASEEFQQLTSRCIQVCIEWDSKRPHSNTTVNEESISILTRHRCRLLVTVSPSIRLDESIAWQVV